MTTPNIDELIDRLYDRHNTSAEQNRLDMQKADDLLQSQAERIKELEAEVEMWKATADAVVDFEKVQLRAELATIAATEPVAAVNDLHNARMFTLEANGYSRKDKLFTRPMPAQDVTELVDALEKLARLGNGEHYGNSDGNMIARDALTKYKGAK